MHVECGTGVAQMRLRAAVDRSWKSVYRKGIWVVSVAVCFWGFAEAMLVVNFGCWNTWSPSGLMKDGENQEGV